MNSELDRTAKVEFWLESDWRMYAMRRMYHVPKTGDFCVFNDVLRQVNAVTWCLDEDATESGVKVQVSLGDEIAPPMN